MIPTVASMLHWNWSSPIGLRTSPLLALSVDCLTVSPCIVLSSIGCICWSARTWVISCRKACGLSTRACASGRGLSKTVAISMAPPSGWINAGRPFCSWSKMASALFSQTVRSHSSTARCINVAFCGGMLLRCGFPNSWRKRVSSELALSRKFSSHTFLRRASSVTSLERVVFLLM